MIQGNGKGKGNRGVWLFAVVLLVTVGCVSGCATTKGDLAGADRTLWQSRDQFVKIEKRDKPAEGTAPANGHPADIPVERLRNVLESIEVQAGDSDKAIPLFYDDELAILSEKVHAGLMAAGPDEDVTFAIIGHYPVFMGLKERMVTTGRVFCQDGQLNVIFGDIHRPVKENEDLRLNPFLPGSRAKAKGGEITLIAKAGSERFALKRPDWVTFPMVGAAPAVAPAARENATGTGAAVTAPSAAPQEKPAAAGRKSIEERLRTLNDLHDKKLITDEEYRAKRQEILKEL